ncbi:hypothetical protein [Ferirhizobium litorale]
MMQAGAILSLLALTLGATAQAEEAAVPAAQTTASKDALDVELNALVPSQKGCMMTFVARNGMAVPVTKISFELAFFNQKNAVDRITVLDFRDLPVGKVRVRQFDMPGVQCDSVSRIIVNDTPVCDGPAAGECMGKLTTRSQLSVPFEG